MNLLIQEKTKKKRKELLNELNKKIVLSDNEKIILENIKQIDTKADKEFDNLINDLQFENKQLEKKVNLLNGEIINLKKELNNKEIANTIYQLENSDNLTPKEKE